MRRELGRGYGRLTPRATRRARRAPGLRLDGVYSAKAAAALRCIASVGPLLFWATKSEVELPAPPLHALREASPALVRWLLK